MSHAAVYELFDRIRSLEDDDRLLLEDLLARQEDAEWRRQASEARSKARKEGVDQEAINRAVAAVRHGG